MTVLEGILFFGKARSKVLLLDLVQRAEAKYRAMVTVCELIWSKQFLDMQIQVNGSHL